MRNAGLEEAQAGIKIAGRNNTNLRYADDTTLMGSIPALGRSPGEGNGNPLQYSCLQNPIDREAWYLSLISEPTPLSASLSFDPICRASPMV